MHINLWQLPLLTITNLTYNHHFNEILTKEQSFQFIKSTCNRSIPPLIIRRPTTFLSQTYDLFSSEYLFFVAGMPISTCFTPPSQRCLHPGVEHIKTRVSSNLYYYPSDFKQYTYWKEVLIYPSFQIGYDSCMIDKWQLKTAIIRRQHAYIQHITQINDSMTVHFKKHDSKSV